LRDPRVNNPLAATLYTFEQTGWFDDEELGALGDFLTAKASGQLDFEQVPEWGVYDNAGNLIKRFGSQDAANTYAEANDYSLDGVRETGDFWWNARNSSTGTSYTGGDEGGGDEGGGDTQAELWSTFKDSIPSGEEEGWNYSRWVSEGRPTNFDTWQEGEGEPGETNFADLYSTTDGKLPSNTESDVLRDVVNAIEGGNQEVVDQFSTRNPSIAQAFSLGAATTETRDGKLQCYAQGFTTEDLTALVGKVIVATPEMLARAAYVQGFGKEPSQSELAAFMDESGTWDETETQSWLVTNVGGNRTGSGGAAVTFTNIDTGDSRTVDFYGYNW
jgi:hypothetical protein